MAITTNKRVTLILVVLGLETLPFTARLAGAQESVDAALHASVTVGSGAVTPYDIWLVCRLPLVAKPDSIPPAGTTISDLKRARMLCGSIDSLSAPGVTINDLGMLLPSTVAIRRLLVSGRSAIDSNDVPQTPIILDTLSAHAGIVFFRNAASLPAVVEDRVRAIGRQVRDYIVAHPQDSVVIVGTADTTGSLQYNVRLAASRAEYLKTVIAQEGVPLQNLKTHACPTPKAADRKPASSFLDRACAELHPGIVGALERPGGSKPLGRAQTRTLEDRSSQIVVALPISTAKSIATRASVDTTNASSTSLELSPSGLAGAFANEIISTAESDVQSDILTRASLQLCGRAARDSESFRPSTYLQATCRMTDSLRKSGDLASVHDLQTRLQTDLWAAPRQLSLYVLEHDDSSAVLQGDAAIFLSVIDALRNRRLTNDPWQVLASSAFRIEPHLQTARPTSEVGRSLVVLTEIAKEYTSATSAIPTIGGTADALESRSVLGAVLRAFLVNVCDSTVNLGPAIQVSAKAFDVVQTINAVRRVNSLASQMRIGGSGPVRPETVVNTLAEVTSAMLPDSVASIVDSVSVVAADVASELNSGHYLPAFSRAVEFESTHQGVPGLPTSSRRAMAFAVGLADAKDQPAVITAVHEFVHEGSGYRAKRLRPFADDSIVDTVPPNGSARQSPRHANLCPVQGWFPTLRGCRRYWTVNSYLGLAASEEYPYGGAGGHRRFQGGYYLPIGLEFGWRPRPMFPGDSTKSLGRSAGVFFQMLDLGGVAAMRLSTRASNSASSTATQFISPGVFATWSWGSGYWSGLAGLSYTPAAQRSAGSRDLSALRVTFVPVSVDIPLFP